MARKTAKKSKKEKIVEEAPKTTKVDLDELAENSQTSITATDYQMYLRNKFKGTK